MAQITPSVAFRWELSIRLQDQPLSTVLLLGAANENRGEDADEAEQHAATNAVEEGVQRSEFLPHLRSKVTDIAIDAIEATAHANSKIVESLVGPGGAFHLGQE